MRPGTPAVWLMLLAIASPRAVADASPLRVGQPVMAAHPAVQSGQQLWRLTAREQQWIALLLVADEATVWSVDSGATQQIEGCDGSGCRWLVLAAQPGQTLTIEVSWSAASASPYILAAATPPSGLRGPQASSMRRIYTLAEVARQLRDDHRAPAAAMVFEQLLSRLAALAAVDPRVAAELASSLAAQLLRRGGEALALELCRQALAHLDPEGAGLMGPWLSLMGLQGSVLLQRGDLDQARSTYSDMDRIASRQQLPSVSLNVARNLLTLELLSGQPQRAAQHISELLSATPPRIVESADRRSLWSSLGIAREAAGDLTGAARAFTEALELVPHLASDSASSSTSKATSDHPPATAPNPSRELAEASQIRLNLGRVLSRLGQTEQARAQFESALELASAGAAPRVRAGALSGLAALHRSAGRSDQARLAAEEALGLLGDDPPPCGSALSALDTLARLALDSGDTIRARARIEQALALLQRLDPPGRAVIAGTGAPLDIAHWSDLRQQLSEP